MNTNTVSGTYGSQKTPCLVFTLLSSFGGTWYCVEGSKNVNYTYEDVDNGVDVEAIYDTDACTSQHPIESEEDLEKFIND